MSDENAPPLGYHEFADEIDKAYAHIIDLFKRNTYPLAATEQGRRSILFEFLTLNNEEVRDEILDAYMTGIVRYGNENGDNAGNYAEYFSTLQQAIKIGIDSDLIEEYALQIIDSIPANAIDLENHHIDAILKAVEPLAPTEIESFREVLQSALAP